MKTRKHRSVGGAQLNRAWNYCPRCFASWRKPNAICPNCKVLLSPDKLDRRKNIECRKVFD